MLCRAAFLGLALAGGLGLHAADTPAPAVQDASTAVAADPYARVTVAPTRTSIYIGVVSMTLPPFTRTGDAYTTTYEAKVIPYFFYNESGTLTVNVNGEQLAQLARGEPITFTGRAVRTDGQERRVEGKATPDDPHSGRIKVRVFVSKSIQLIFNTTYRFEAAAGQR